MCARRTPASARARLPPLFCAARLARLALAALLLGGTLLAGRASAQGPSRRRLFSVDPAVELRERAKARGLRRPQGTDPRQFGTPRHPELWGDARGPGAGDGGEGRRLSKRFEEDQGVGLGVPFKVEQYTEQLLRQEAACVDSPDDRLDLDSPVIVGRELLNDDEKRELGRRIDGEKERRRRKKRLGGEPRLLEVY